MDLLAPMTSADRDARASRRSLAGWARAGAWILGSTLLGLACVVAGNFASARPAFYAALPLALVLVFTFLLDARTLLAGIVLLRAVGDPLFQSTGVTNAGGLGGVVNLAVIAIAASFVLREPRRVPRAAWWAWAPFLLAQGVGLLHSPDTFQQLRLLLGLVSTFAMFIAAFYLVDGPDAMDRVARLILASSVPVVLLTFAYVARGQTATDFIGTESVSGRFAGPFSHPNILAFYAVLNIGLVLYRLKGRHRAAGPWAVAMYLGWLAMLLAALYVTKTRSAWLAAAVLFGAYGLFFERRYLAYLLAVPALGMLLPEFRDRILDITQGNTVTQYAHLNSFAWRKLLWTSALQWMTPLHYLMGYGAGGFREHSVAFFPLADDIHWDAHSVLVQLFFDVGAVGLGCYLLVYRGCLRMMRPLARADAVLALVGTTLLLGYLLVSASDNMLAYLVFNWYFWLFIGAACACGCAVRPAPAGVVSRPARPSPRMTRGPSTRVTAAAGALCASACLAPAAGWAGDVAQPQARETPPSAVFGTYLRPFSAQSPWNSRPIQPVLGEFEIPKAAYFPSVAEGTYSSGIFLAGAADAPMEVLPVPGRKGVWDPDAEAWHDRIVIPHWPAGVVPAGGTDAHADIVDPALNIVHSFYQLRFVDGHWQAAQYAWTRLDGRGWGDPAHYFQGARAAAVPTMGGMIRKHEINDGDTVYHHALAISLSLSGLGPDPSYVFPATSSDKDAAQTNKGVIPEGALLMLPADYDTRSIANPRLRKVAETLKLFGGYVVDKNVGTPFAIYVENGSGFSLHGPQWDNATARELDRMRGALRRVTGAARWVDGNGAPVDLLHQPFNLLSMRGQWVARNGPPAGVFDTWRQAVVFPATDTRERQSNSSGRDISGVTWARPQPGDRLRLTVRATGGGALRLQLFDAKGASLFDSTDLADGASAEFVWPAGLARTAVSAVSGVGPGSTVGGTLEREAAK